MLTHARLKALLAYDDLSGEFTWLVTRNGFTKAGSRAGTPSGVGYELISVDRKRYKSHRLAWFYVYGFWPSTKDLDHINGDRSDNRIANLREATRSQNAINSKIRSDNKSGIRGVQFHKLSGKWAAAISYGGKTYHLGLFATKQEAQACREIAESKYHLQFARGQNEI